VPIYEYACKECDHSLDALQKMSDDPLLECPECGEPALKRLLSAPRFRLERTQERLRAGEVGRRQET
jgi:putative FmdB family regulatory protein